MMVRPTQRPLFSGRGLGTISLLLHVTTVIFLCHD